MLIWFSVISADKFLGGRMKLDVGAASAAIHKHIALPLFNGDVIAAAAGIRRVVDLQMADLIRKTTLQRGHDPRAFALMAFGGSGPVHAASYGADLGMSEIIIPFNASVHSAFGSALSDVRFSLRYSDPLTLPVEPARLEICTRRWKRAATSCLPMPMLRKPTAASNDGWKPATAARFTPSGCASQAGWIRSQAWTK